MIVLVLVPLLVLATTAVHGLGTMEAIIRLTRRWQRPAEGKDHWLRGFPVIRLVSVLLILHLVEAAIWALPLWLAGVITDVEAAYFYSLSCYTTVGFGDVQVPPPWRLMGVIEAAVGILMFGWSTSVVIAVVMRLFRHRVGLDEDAAP